jgi:transcriptional regulator with XRE-family HTH domain
VERLELQQFARRLHELMVQKGLSQSDLAREVWGTTTDTRGYTVAKNRDRIGAYLRAESLPEPQNMARLAEALGTKAEDLAPEIVAATVDRENPELAVTMVAGHPDKAHLQVNKLVPIALAAKVMALLIEEHA